MSGFLSEARRFEEEREKEITKGERPGFHCASRVGWMNDPNGFSYYNGKYHLFYQYHPYSSFWGPMHWGHAVSEDLLHWEYLPAALAPDQAYDEKGCFSGSAWSLPDGRHLLLYTGVSKEAGKEQSGRDLQFQCVAVGDGTDYEKYADNPVLTDDDLPEGASKYDFRDPKVWQTADGTYRLVAGNCDDDNDGRILLYGSPDGFHWSYRKTLAVNGGRFGKMWECPDFFALDGKQVMLISPTDMLADGVEYHSGNGTVCLIGTYDEGTENFKEERNQAIDYGIDFYAPQTLLSPDGRRIMIGWMQNWDTCNFHSSERKWFGQMSIPRELSVKDGRLIQQPVRELQDLHGPETRYEAVRVNGTLTLDKIRGRMVDMELSVRPENGEKSYRKFTVGFAADERFRTTLSYSPYDSVVEVDRSLSGIRRAIPHICSSRVGRQEGVLRLRIVLDRFSAEVFVNGGEQVMTVTLDTDQTADGIFFSADGSVLLDIVKYDLR